MNFSIIIFIIKICNEMLIFFCLFGAHLLPVYERKYAVVTIVVIDKSQKSFAFPRKPY